MTTLSSLAPWTDRNGRLSALRACVFALASLPLCWMASKWFAGQLSPKPVTDLLRESGDWAMRFIVVVLAVSPLRNAARWNRIIAVRRMLGLFAMFYIGVHLFFYFVDQQFVLWRIALELALRTYLTIGLIAVIVFAILAATSSDAAVRRLGVERWNRLHALIYVAATLAIVHYFMQVRLKAYEPSLIAGLLVILGLYRLLRKYRGDLEVLPLFGVACAGAILAALIEAGYYWYAMNAPLAIVLQSNLDFSYEIRPAWYVLAAGLLFACVVVVRKIASAPILSRLIFPRRTETAPHR